MPEGVRATDAAAVRGAAFTAAIHFVRICVIPWRSLIRMEGAWSWPPRLISSASYARCKGSAFPLTAATKASTTTVESGATAGPLWGHTPPASVSKRIATCSSGKLTSRGQSVAPAANIAVTGSERPAPARTPATRTNTPNACARLQASASAPWHSSGKS
eukprot:scaffold1072_cov356-Prasinococcus_capsulatus_cf.AAC.9